MPYSRDITQTGDQAKNQTDNKFMKTNTIQVITVTFAIGLIAAVTGLEVTGSLLVGVAIGVSYFTVAALIAMAASDYRSGPKAYFVTPVVTGHFQRSMPASLTPHVPGEKARMAA
jgi:hypothetical protein